LKLGVEKKKKVLQNMYFAVGTYY